MSRRVERHNERSDRDLHASDKKRPAPDSQMQTGKTKKSKSDQILDSLYDDVKKNPESIDNLEPKKKKKDKKHSKEKKREKESKSKKRTKRTKERRRSGSEAGSPLPIISREGSHSFNLMNRRVERRNERSDRDQHASDEKRPAPDNQTEKTKKSKSDQILDSLYDDVKKNPESIDNLEPTKDKKHSKEKKREKESKSKKRTKHTKERRRSGSEAGSPLPIISRERSRSKSPSHKREDRGRSRDPSAECYDRGDRPPKFDLRRQMQTRRKILLSTPWRQRVDTLVRSSVNHNRRGRGGMHPLFERGRGRGRGRGFGSCLSRYNPPTRFCKEDYMDEFGNIDKKQLLEIATKNATKLAMEGKLPKGAELLDTIKNKSVDQLVSLCKHLQEERDVMEKVSSDDEEERYDRRFEDWRRSKLEREERDDEFVSRPVRPSNEIKINIYSRPRENEKVQHNFPVSSGIHHRSKALDDRIWDDSNKKLVALGEIGPLTTALSRVKTNIPSAYRPPDFELAPISNLSALFESSTASLMPPPVPPKLFPSTHLSPPPTPPSLLQSNAYNIAMAAVQKASSTVPTPVVMQPVRTTMVEAPTPPLLLPPPPTPPVLSSWDTPGHILLTRRQELLRKNSANMPPLVPMISSGEPSFEPSPSLISSDFQRKLSAPSLRSSVPVVNKEVLTSSASNIGPKLPPHLIKPSSSNQESTSTQSSDFLTRLDTLVTNQVARAKANSELQATIISAQLALPAPPIPNKELVKTSAVFRETIGLTRAPKPINDLVADRLKFSERLKRNPNDYHSRKRLAELEEEIANWAQGSSEPGLFTGSTGASILSEDQLQPSNPRFHAWAKKAMVREHSCS